MGPLVEAEARTGRSLDDRQGGALDRQGARLMVQYSPIG
jgi:hypothetical protein